jgi:hypothetical protein
MALDSVQESRTDGLDPDSLAIEEVLRETVSEIRTSLNKDGADITVAVDITGKRVVATLERQRITCHDCLLPEDVVQKLLRHALKGHSAGRSYQIETHNWLPG